ncbi:hypothetical protein ACSBL2_04050 [Pedobacter sp. AW31-3R]|uniref:hypothetical protein n=1 Tax=Pedobacter sp. AW31-3R TaxID=3445781 RepID=UPI003F9F4E5D
MRFKLNNSYSIRQINRSGGFLFLMTTIFCLSSFAQKTTGTEDLPLDERGKYIRYEVVEKKDIPTDSLRYRAAAFLKVKKLSGITAGNEPLTAGGKFLISKTAFVLTRPSGEVSYHFAFEIKEGKYRFWLTDFEFTPYKRDRYANYVPSTGKKIPLETVPDKWNKAEWESYVTATAKQSAAFADDFKEYLAAEKKIVAQPKAKTSVSTKNW